jgi:hypothetical protein
MKYEYHIKVTHEKEADKAKKIEWSPIVSAISAIISAVALVFTAINYKTTNKWKKAEFVAAQYDKFYNDKAVEIVSNNLDYTARAQQLPSGDSLLRRENITTALLPDSISSTIDYKDKAFIRDQVDRYLDLLSLFERCLQAEILTEEDIKPYFRRDIELLGKRSDDINFRRFQASLWGYIKRYQFHDVPKFFRHFDSLEITDVAKLAPLEDTVEKYVTSAPQGPWN